MYKIIKIVKKTGTTLGLSAAFGGGVLAGIESAIMWPANKILTGTIFGAASCFINSLSYYYVVMRGTESNNNNINYVYTNSKKSNLFLVIGFFLGGVMAVSNFNGMYVSYTVLGEKLNELGDRNVNIPEELLEILAIFFGVASSASGILFNLTVGHKIWNDIRKSRNDVENIITEKTPLVEFRYQKQSKIQTLLFPEKKTKSFISTKHRRNLSAEF